MQWGGIEKVERLLSTGRINTLLTVRAIDIEILRGIEWISCLSTNKALEL
jgi:hypothetical protein